MGLGPGQHKGGGGRGRGEDDVQVPAQAWTGREAQPLLRRSLAVQVEDKNDVSGLRQDRCPEGMGSGWSCGLGSMTAAHGLPRGRQVSNPWSLSSGLNRDKGARTVFRERSGKVVTLGCRDKA